MSTPNNQIHNFDTAPPARFARLCLWLVACAGVGILVGDYLR